MCTSHILVNSTEPSSMPAGESEVKARHGVTVDSMGLEFGILPVIPLKILEM